MCCTFSGSNSSGQCGRPQPSDADVAPAAPTYLVEAIVGLHVSSVAAGSNFTLAAVAGTGVISFGANHFGQLGRETEQGSDATPALVDIEPACCLTVDGLSCGDDHAIFLSDRSVYVWGRGTQAALGLGGAAKNVTRPLPLPASGDVKSVLLAKSSAALSVAAGGANSALLSSAPALPRPVPVPQLRGQVGVSMAGPARDAASLLFTWGANKFGELGHGDTAKRTVPRLVKMLKGTSASAAAPASVFAVSLGASHAAALMEWRVVGASGRGLGGGGTPSDSLSSSYSSSTPGTPSTPSTPGSFAASPGLSDLLSRSYSGESGAGVFKASVSPPGAKSLAFNSGYPSKGGHKPRYSAGGGRNCREIKTPKKKEKEGREAKRSGGKESRTDSSRNDVAADDCRSAALKDGSSASAPWGRDLRSQVC